MLGSKSAQAIEDMVGYAQETQHEKILRGLAVGIAMVMYGRMEEADALIESLCRDKVFLFIIHFESMKPYSYILEASIVYVSHKLKELLVSVVCEK